MFGHPNNVHYSKSMRLYDWKDNYSRHLMTEEIVASVILGGVLVIPFILALIFQSKVKTFRSLKSLKTYESWGSLLSGCLGDRFTGGIYIVRITYCNMQRDVLPVLNTLQPCNFIQYFQQQSLSPLFNRNDDCRFNYNIVYF